MKKISVWCWPAGHLEFGKHCPSGAIPIAIGPEPELRKIISTLARHSYDGKNLVIPGVPEAKDDTNAVLAALWRFSDQVDEQLLQRRQSAQGVGHA